jgi:hypothetical protein
MDRSVMAACPACEGEGRLSYPTHVSREDGCWDGYQIVCEECCGTGAVRVETYPVEEADLVPLVPA